MGGGDVRMGRREVEAMGQRILRMSDVFLPVIFGNRDGGGWRVRKNPLPPDAKVVRAWMEIGRYGLPEVVLAMESVAWPELVPGDAQRDVEPMMIESIRSEPTPEPSVRPATEAKLPPGWVDVAIERGGQPPGIWFQHERWNLAIIRGPGGVKRWMMEPRPYRDAKGKLFATTEEAFAWLADNDLVIHAKRIQDRVLGLTAEPPEVLWFEDGPWKGAFLCPHPVRDVVKLPCLTGGQYVYRDAGRRTDDGRRIFEVQISPAEPELPKPEESFETITRLRRHEIALRETPGYREAFLAWFKGQATPDQLRLLGEANGIKPAEPEPPKAAEPERRIKFREFF